MCLCFWKINLHSWCKKKVDEGICETFCNFLVSKCFGFVSLQRRNEKKSTMRNKFETWSKSQRKYVRKSKTNRKYENKFGKTPRKIWPIVGLFTKLYENFRKQSESERKPWLYHENCGYTTKQKSKVNKKSKQILPFFYHLSKSFTFFEKNEIIPKQIRRPSSFFRWFSNLYFVERQKKKKKKKPKNLRSAHFFNSERQKKNRRWKRALRGELVFGNSDISFQVLVSAWPDFCWRVCDQIDQPVL